MSVPCDVQACGRMTAAVTIYKKKGMLAWNEGRTIQLRPCSSEGVSRIIGRGVKIKTRLGV